MTNLDTKALEAAPRVKPLEWTRAPFGAAHTAETILGEYVASTHGETGVWFPPGDGDAREVHGDLDAAKSAAQAHYEGCILSVLDLAVASPRSAVLEEAARVAAEARLAAIALAKFLADDERGGEVLVEDFHVLVTAMGLLNSAANLLDPPAAIRSLSKETVNG